MQSEFSPTCPLEQTHARHVLNILYPGAKGGNAYACLRYCLRFVYARTGFAYTYLVLRGPDASLLSRLRHTRTRGPFLNMNTRVLNMPHMCTYV